MTDERIIAYLLKELPEEELERFEDECFDQETWPEEEISLVEEELIELYLRNELEPERRERFERDYLITAPRHNRVARAAALLRHADERHRGPLATPIASQAQPTWAGRIRALLDNHSIMLRVATAVIALAIIGGASWFFYFRALTSPKISASLVGSTVSLTISRGNRAEGTQPGVATLPHAPDTLRVLLLLPQQAPADRRYRVEIESESGKTHSVIAEGIDARSVKVDIPGEELARGKYAFRLFVIEPGGTEQRISGSYFLDVE